MNTILNNLSLSNLIEAFEKEKVTPDVVASLSGGRGGQVTLGHILKFVTGSENEPVLGFTIRPTITFCPVETKERFFPRSNTCVNNLNLPRPSQLHRLPNEVLLFDQYDFAFCNSYFGQI